VVEDKRSAPATWCPEMKKPAPEHRAGFCTMGYCWERLEESTPPITVAWRTIATAEATPVAVASPVPVTTSTEVRATIPSPPVTEAWSKARAAVPVAILDLMDRRDSLGDGSDPDLRGRCLDRGEEHAGCE
jgi:hypothetical protein